MIQEYLLQEPAEKDAVKTYKPEGISKRLFLLIMGTAGMFSFLKMVRMKGLLNDYLMLMNMFVPISM